MYFDAPVRVRILCCFLESGSLMSASSASRVQMVNLGCAKNLVDSEEMLGVLARDGFSVARADEDADVVVINTCGFIEAARQESVDAILQAVERKRRGEVRRVVVAGCMVQRYPQELAAELPEVDGFLGTGRLEEIVSLVGTARSGEGPVSLVAEVPHHRWVDNPVRVRATSRWTAYLKISEGCDHACTFCAIPSFRGRHVSKPLERVVEEAHALAEAGVLELNLIAQDSTQYGYDLYGRMMLPELLERLSAVPGLRWIRLFYCYPSRVNDAVISAVAGTPKVLPYIDMPLQHADDAVLRAMRRPMSGDAYLGLVERFRAACPDVAIRTTFIVGFPGETEAQFGRLVEFVEAAEFDRVGVFEYSLEEGTPSASLSGRVNARTRRDRKDRLMRVQREISLRRNQRWVGRELEVLVESVERSGGGERMVSGRSFRDAPEIDGRVFVRSRDAVPGEMVRVRIESARAYDLLGDSVQAAHVV
jgi:ribosomal protein S12 methylthiotransferase